MLLARIERLLRPWTESANTPIAPQSLICVGGLKIDSYSHEVSLDGVPIHLTPTEFRLLVFLVRNRGRALSYQELFRVIWAQDYSGIIIGKAEKDEIKVFINSLRRKLRGSGFEIKSKRGYGYIFE